MRPFWGRVSGCVNCSHLTHRSPKDEGRDGGWEWVTLSPADLLWAAAFPCPSLAPTLPQWCLGPPGLAIAAQVRGATRVVARAADTHHPSWLLQWRELPRTPQKGETGPSTGTRHQAWPS